MYLNVALFFFIFKEYIIALDFCSRSDARFRFNHSLLPIKLDIFGTSFWLYLVIWLLVLNKKFDKEKAYLGYFVGP